ncbi:hypothetical protein HY995_02935 [Candidatus Micrarchaeota archaeon]|nr:hypothetical protein [Candidatus Micrarchaeota archaeon]
MVSRFARVFILSIIGFAVFASFAGAEASVSKGYVKLPSGQLLSYAEGGDFLGSVNSFFQANPYQGLPLYFGKARPAGYLFLSQKVSEYYLSKYPSELAGVASAVGVKKIVACGPGSGSKRASGLSVEHETEDGTVNAGDCHNPLYTRVFYEMLEKAQQLVDKKDAAVAQDVQLSKNAMSKWRGIIKTLRGDESSTAGKYHEIRSKIPCQLANDHHSNLADSDAQQGPNFKACRAARSVLALSATYVAEGLLDGRKARSACVPNALFTGASRVAGLGAGGNYKRLAQYAFDTVAAYPKGSGYIAAVTNDAADPDIHAKNNAELRRVQDYINSHKDGIPASPNKIRGDAVRAVRDYLTTVMKLKGTDPAVAALDKC